MVRRLQPTQARFLLTITNKQLADCGELRRTEIMANDPNFVTSLNKSESKEALMRDLIAHLPLLNPKNLEVKAIYLALMSKVFKYVQEHCALVEEARQLLSYSLIHPVFTTEDRGQFTTWLALFDQLNPGSLTGGSNGNAGTSPSSGDEIREIRYGTNNSSTHAVCGSPPSNEFYHQQSSLSGSPANYGTNFQRIQRSNSLTPPVQHSDTWTSQEELCVAKPRSLSLSSEVSPQSSLPSSGSGSETHLGDPRPTFTSPGMKDVPLWLKSLRLHKYSFLFAHLTFEQMLTVTEDDLEQQGVTKGARHKIVLSIGKLRDRVGQLKQMSDQMTRDKDCLRNALAELKWMLTTPIKPSFAKKSPPASTTKGPRPQSSTTTTSDEQPCSSSSSSTSNGNYKADAELTAWIVHVIGKACEINPDPELLVSILDRCLIHEAFTEKQKRILTLWRQQHATVRRNSVGHPHFHGHSSHHHRGSGSPGGNHNGSSKHGGGNVASGSGSRHFSPRVLNINHQHGHSSHTSNHSPWGNPGSSMHAMFMAKRPSLQDQFLESTRSKLAVQRTKSAPIPNCLAQGLSLSPPITQFDNLNPLVGGTAAADFIGLNFPDSVPSLGLNHSTMRSGMGLEHGLLGMGGVDSLGFGQNQPSSTPPTGSIMSNKDITTRLESLCLSMTEAAIGVPCTNY